MNKLEQNMVAAVNGGYNWKSGNTEVRVNDGVTIVLLHGNEIFRKTPVMTSYSDAGWPTKTTASRLRSLGANITLHPNYSDPQKGCIIFND